MENLYGAYSADPEMESGVGVTLNFGVCQIHTRRAGGSNKRYADALRKMTQPFRRQIQNDTVDPDKLNEVFMRCYSRTVVLGWENVTDREGKKLEFNEVNFVQVMKDLPDLWLQLQDECTKLSNFRAVTNEEDGEQLGNSSSGTSNGEVPLTT